VDPVRLDDKKRALKTFKAINKNHVVLFPKIGFKSNLQRASYKTLLKIYSLVFKKFFFNFYQIIKIR